MKKKSLGAYILAVGAFLLAKSKWLLALLKWTKFGGTLISMGVSLGLYAMAYGWKFAVALVYLIFVHEMGHVIAAKHKGVATSPAFFIPFVGAFIAMKEKPRDARTEAYMAYGGPLAGLLSFLPAIPLYLATEEPFWALVIFLGAILNLFNLIPVTPLDGGRIVSALSTHIWLAGLLLLAGYVIVSPNWMLILILLIGLGSWWNRMREGYRYEVLDYERNALREFRSQLGQWPGLWSTADTKWALQNKIRELKPIAERKKRWHIPFLQDKHRLEQERARIDVTYTGAALELLTQWEYTPVLYEDGDPSRPIANALLVQAEAEAAEKEKKLEEELRQLQTYYKAPASAKWKILGAYLALVLVLSLFAWYGHGLMELHQEGLR